MFDFLTRSASRIALDFKRRGDARDRKRKKPLRRDRKRPTRAYRSARGQRREAMRKATCKIIRAQQARDDVAETAARLELGDAMSQARR